MFLVSVINEFNMVCKNQDELYEKSLPGRTNVLGHQELPSIFPHVYSACELQMKNNYLINIGKY